MAGAPLHHRRVRCYSRAAMEICFTEGAVSDGITVERADGSTCAFRLPHKGPTPHDTVHYFVERELGRTRGFWGLVASGLNPDAVGALAIAGGHASAKRLREPDTAIVELIQAERLVECFEAEAWSGSRDDQGLRDMAAAGWSASRVPPLELGDTAIDAIRSALGSFMADWQATRTGGSLQLIWTLD